MCFPFPLHPWHNPYPPDHPLSNKKAPSWLKEGAFRCLSPSYLPRYLTLLDLAPASHLEQDRLLWLHRASPSATLDKKVSPNFLDLTKIDYLSGEWDSLLPLFLIFRPRPFCCMPRTSIFFCNLCHPGSKL